MEIDFVTKSWIFYVENSCQLMKKYLSPPYEDEECWALFNSIVKSELPASEDWPIYPVILKGHAAHQQAVKRLKLLEKEHYAYIDNGGEVKSKEITRVIHSKQYAVSEATTSNLKVPSLDEPIPIKQSAFNENRSDVDNNDSENSFEDILNYNALKYRKFLDTNGKFNGKAIFDTKELKKQSFSENSAKPEEFGMKKQFAFNEDRNNAVNNEWKDSFEDILIDNASKYRKFMDTNGKFNRNPIPDTKQVKKQTSAGNSAKAGIITSTVLLSNMKCTKENDKLLKRF
ncbi:uncharacterized protein LOC117169183 isoform X2 [Belonocnema kinseyi]|uniref:uncharacterized protein LOC117169183 isoform X2 n=1 Tax=Belonocnema kinseyi TaxID=2817044 RepID=UPI00143CE6B5|nr:uncharacterized protein LOC117169183 isoform X2 [Belonocnema kinseyi]